MRYDAASAHLESWGLGTTIAFRLLDGRASLSVSVRGRHSAFMRPVHTTKKTGTFNVTAPDAPELTLHGTEFMAIP